MGAETAVKPWDWRKCMGGVWLTIDSPAEPRFHAYDVNNNAACRPAWGLLESVEEPNEGSDFCPECIEVVKATPAGREPR